MNPSQHEQDTPRLRALRALKVLDTPPEERFDRITRLAAQFFDVPIALLSIVDEDRQWFKSRYGLAERSTPRSQSFCQHAVASRQLVLVDDARLDPRFVDNPLVTGAPHIRFYAGQPVFSADGHALGTLCIIDSRPRQLSAAQIACLRDFAMLAQEQLLAAPRRLGVLHTDALLDAAHDAFIGIDAQGVVTDWNRAAEKTFGWTRQETLGATLTDTIIPERLHGAHQHGMQRYLAEGTGAVINQRIEVPARTKDGRELAVEMTISPYQIDGQTFFGAFLHDISAQKATASELAFNENRLRAITEHLPALIGHIDSDERVLFLNRHAISFYGIEGEQVQGMDVRRLYTEASYAEVAPYMHKAMAGQKASFESRLEVRGVTRYYSAVYIPDMQGLSGRHGFYAMAFDITQRKASELLQAQSEERLRTITDNLPVLIAYVDRDEVYRFANATFRTWFGADPRQIVGRKVSEVLGEALYSQGRSFLQRNLAGEKTRFEATHVIRDQVRTAEVVGIPHVQDGQVLGVYIMSTDISDNKQHEQQLQLLARSDPLTGLPNRRGFEEKLREAVLRSVRSGQFMALMYLDIDHFKLINDTLGHAGGDDVLKEFALRLRASVRATDTVCRLAGDEFTIVVEGLGSASDAIPVADKILAAIRQPFFVAASLRSVSTSIGIASMHAAQLETGQLIKHADDALYAAKREGRNRYHLHGAPARHKPVARS